MDEIVQKIMKKFAKNWGKFLEKIFWKKLWKQLCKKLQKFFISRASMRVGYLGYLASGGANTPTTEPLPKDNK